MSFGAELSRAKAVAGPPKVVAELAQKQAEVDRMWREGEFFVRSTTSRRADGRRDYLRVAKGSRFRGSSTCSGSFLPLLDLKVLSLDVHVV